MPIGKDSITKRVAKTETVTKKVTPPETEPQENIAPELVATVGVAPKAPAKKASTAKKPASTAKKPTSKPAEKAAAEVTTGVISNIAPETVEAVIGHKEDEKYQKVQIGEKMPSFLM